jgi:hypothetical protein
MSQFLGWLKGALRGHVVLVGLRGEVWVRRPGGPTGSITDFSGVPSS